MKNRLFYFVSFIIFFVINLTLILFSREYPLIDLHCAKTEINATSLELIDSNPSCDTSSNLMVSLNLFNGTLSDSSIKTLSNWPIGMPLLFKLFLWLETIGVPFILGFAIFLSLLLGYFINEFFKIALKHNRFWLGIVFIFIFLFSSPNEGWISGSGLLYPEGISIIILLVAFLRIASIDSSRNFTLKDIVYVSICFSISAYFRAIFELQLNILFGLLLFIYLSSRSKYISNLMLRKFTVSKRIINSFLVILAVAFVLLIPWRIISEKVVHPGNYGWTAAYNKWWISWIPTERLSEFNISFDSAQGGINMACELNPQACKDFDIPLDYMNKSNIEKNSPVFLNTYLSTIVQNPLKYLDLRLSIIRNFWLQDNQYNYLRSWNFTEGYAFVFILLTSIITLLLYFKKFIFTSTIYVVSISIQFLVLFLHHVEARYFIGIKLMSLTYVFLILIMSTSNNKKIENSF